MLYTDDSRSQFPPSPNPFVPNNLPDSRHFHSLSPRFNVSLEAPTALALQEDDVPLTYINRGQYYIITLNDTQEYDGDIETTVILAFHDHQHRRVASSFWKFWLGQQASTSNPRAIDIDQDHSQGTYGITLRSFDRISFNWRGKNGARVFLRFNCLSTDFSRIKGVKGIPLRIHVESRVIDEPGNKVEKCICRVRIFRDKGAQRKLKDERKHVEKQIEKLRAEDHVDVESHPLWKLYTAESTVTPFSLLYTSNTGVPEAILPISQETFHPPPRMPPLPPPPIGESSVSMISPIPDPPLPPGFSYMATQSLHTTTHPPTALDIDPTYVPRSRSSTSVLNIFIRYAQHDTHYRAVYLHRFTVTDLVDKICQKININPASVTGVIRLKGHLNIAVDDQVIEAMREEQSIDVDYDMNPDGSLTLLLSY
ncbi:CP2 transcription factor-domain-containing protein [Umbelopsis sp. PMI_123]|nr:CP2 transcription factor-domain-containing protein [Umbelopsis sp. PMI_123]